MVLLVFFFTEPLVTVFARGFSAERFTLTVAFTRIGILSVYFMLFTHVYTAYLNIRGHYAVPMLMGFPLNFAYILSFYLAKTYSLDYLAYGIIAAAASQAIILAFYARRLRGPIRLNFDLKDHYVKSMVTMSLPAILGISVNKVNVVVDKTFASIIDGGVSTLNYADKISLMVQGILTTPLVTIFYPSFSKKYAENKPDEMRELLQSYILQIFTMLLPAQLAIMFFAEDVITIIFRGGMFQEEAVRVTTGGLFFYSFGILFFGLRELLSKAFFAIEDTKTPMINGIIGVSINILLNKVLIEHMGINGLALATSITSFFTFMLLLVLFRKKSGLKGPYLEISAFLKVCFMSIVMIGLAVFTNNVFKEQGFSILVSFLPTMLVGAGSYFAMMLFFGFFSFKGEEEA